MQRLFSPTRPCDYLSCTESATIDETFTHLWTDVLRPRTDKDRLAACLGGPGTLLCVTPGTLAYPPQETGLASTTLGTSADRGGVKITASRPISQSAVSAMWNEDFAELQAQLNCASPLLGVSH